jgi:hypothetical protein
MTPTEREALLFLLRYAAQLGRASRSKSGPETPPPENPRIGLDTGDAKPPISRVG